MTKRIVFIDLLRGWATLVMIEVHVFNAFLHPDLRGAGWFEALNFMNGLVAPAFLFVAGVVFVIVSEQKLEEFRTLGAAFWKQLGRIFLIWGVGYALHVPFFSFTRTVNETDEAGWLKFYQADVLHCIALGLLILFLARIIVRSRTVFLNLITALGLAAMTMAPFVWEIDFSRSVPALFGAYLNGQHFSQFPIFPWLGFMLFGGQVGGYYLEMKESGREGRFVRMISWWGIALIAVYVFLNLLSLPPFAGYNIRANPLFFGLRFGIVLVFLAICWNYVRIRNTGDSLVLDVSRESLLVYTAHLLLIYGTFWGGKSFASIYGKMFSPLECLLLTAGLVSVMVVAAKAWGAIKERSRPIARRISVATGVIALLIFFFKQV